MYRIIVASRLLLFGLLLLEFDRTLGDEPVSPAPSHAARMKAGRDLFQKEVRSILIGRCLKCHGGETTESEFDLNTREALLKGGVEGPVVSLDKPLDSRLLALIEHRIEPLMPANAAKLPDRQLAAIRQWIEWSAPYDRPLVNKDQSPDDWIQRQIEPSAREFWSFQPLMTADPPPIDGQPGRGTEIDRFVTAKLNEHQLQPNGAADRRVLIRRLYFDLLGLPPAFSDVERFARDDDPNAYEQLVDRLLESPQYGERWARHWLDVVRFAESHGFEQDYDRPFAYHFRDFVIWALNSDLPFDQFVRWQLAGDEWEPDNPRAQMATGFLGAGVFPTQLTEKEFESARYDELDDMLSTVGTAMLGLTIGCARCHDHKFDPIPAADYYRLLSTFTTAIRSNIELDLNPGHYREALAKWELDLRPLAAELRKFESEQLPGRFEQWLLEQRQRVVAEKPTNVPEPTWIIASAVEPRSQGGAQFVRQPDGSFLATGPNADFDRYTFTVTTHLQGLTALRIEALADDSLARKGPGRAENGNFGLGGVSVTVQPVDMPAPKEPVVVKLKNPRATFQQNVDQLSIAASLDDNPKTGWAVDPQFGKDQAAVLDFTEPIGFPSGTTLTVALDFGVNLRHNIGRPRLALTRVPSGVPFDGPAQSQEVVELRAILGKNAELTQTELGLLRSWHRGTDPDWQRLSSVVDGHMRSKPQPQRTQVMVVTEGQKPLKHNADDRGFPHFYPQTHFLKRGDAGQKQGIAEAGFLQVLTDPSITDSGRAWRVPGAEGSSLSFRRRALSSWITDADRGAGQLLARVIVNRLWQHHLGRGIVASPNDFGAQGERPTHPELLDWLARQLIAHDWRLKPLHKLIVTSAAYQRSSQSNEPAMALDPENRWLWRHVPRRLEAEVLRDAMLAVSGTLDGTMYGPGSLDEGHRRRSIYFTMKRSKLISSMQIFDAPEPLVSIGERPSTTVAPQALLFMNNSQVRLYASNFASKLLAQSANDASSAAVVRRGYAEAASRPPNDEELASGAEFIEEQARRYAAAGRANVRELAVADFCQVLLSLNEFVYSE